jgi:hypothetical protein
MIVNYYLSKSSTHMLSLKDLYLTCLVKKKKKKENPLNNKIDVGRRRWLSGTILSSLVLDSTGLWVQISARTYSLEYHHGGDITGGFCPGAGFPSCHKSIYRVSEDNFRGSACVSEWMLISVKMGGWSFIT